MLHPELFRRDNSGRTRTWRVEQRGNSWRVSSGLKDGAKVQSGWIHCTGKQGRSDAAQVEFEVASAYRYQLAREYHDTEDTIGAAKFFRPMLARKYAQFAPGFAQPKLDGIRCIARIEGLFTREGQPIGGAPHVHHALMPLFAKDPDAILDGELYNHRLHDDFNAIVSLVRRKAPDPEHLEKSASLVEYHVYDMPSDQGRFSERYAALAEAGAGLQAIVPVETHALSDEAEYDDLHGAWLEAGYEGSMWRADAAYEQKRSKTLLKRKEFQDAEYPCLAIEAGTGNWAGLAKSVLCQLPDGRTFRAGIKGSQERARALLDEEHLVVTVQYFHLTPDGIPRFPVVTKFWGQAREL